MQNPEIAGKYLSQNQLPQQKLVETTEAETIQTEEFQFIENFKGMEIFSTAGTLIATDGDIKVLTPYDNCILIMPSKRNTWPHSCSLWSYKLIFIS